MLEVGEYYTYVSGGSEFEVEYLGIGIEGIVLNDGTPIDSKPVRIYQSKSGGTLITIDTVKKSHKINGTKYKSTGSVVPIRYLGEGKYTVEVTDPNPDLKYTITPASHLKSGSVFQMYGRPIVLDEVTLQDKVHPTEVVMDHLEKIIKRGTLTGRVVSIPSPAPGHPAAEPLEEYKGPDF